jgi:hypothetical protein
MPEKSTRPSSQTSSPSTSQSSLQSIERSEQDLYGNSAIQEGIQAESSSSLSSFETTWNEITSEGALTEYAVDAVDGALSGLRDWLQDQAAPDQTAAAAQFVRELQSRVDTGTRKVMTDYGLAKWLNQHPEVIVAGALTAAAAYILTNQKIPELKGSVEVADGHSLSGGLDLGTTLEIALRSYQLGYAYSSDSFTASASYTQSLQDDSWKVSGKLEADLVQMGLVSFADELRAYVRGSYENDGSWDSSAGIEARNGNWSYGLEAFANDDGFANADSGVQAVLKFKF